MDGRCSIDGHIQRACDDSRLWNPFELQLTESKPNAAMGLSIVHANRSLKERREAGLVTLKSARIVMANIRRLGEYSDFDTSDCTFAGHIRAASDRLDSRTRLFKDRADRPKN